MRGRTAWWSSPRRATAICPGSARTRTRAIRPRSLMWSASARSIRRPECRASRIATRATSTSARRGADRVHVPVRAHLPDLRAARLLALRVERPDRRERHLVLRPARLARQPRSCSRSTRTSTRTRWRTSSSRPRPTSAASGGTRAPGSGRLNVRDALSARRGSLVSVPLATATRRTTTPGLKAQRLYGSRPSVRATIDYFDDPQDVYAVYAAGGAAPRVSVDGPKGQRPTLVLWRPGTTHVTPVTQVALRTGKILAFKTGFDPVVSVQGEPVRLVLPPHAGAAEPLRPLPADGQKDRLTVRGSSLVRHLADRLCRVADDDGAGRDVGEHDRARADERLLADLDPRQEHCAAADAGTATDRRARASAPGAPPFGP